MTRQQQKAVLHQKNNGTHLRMHTITDPLLFRRRMSMGTGDLLKSTANFLTKVQKAVKQNKDKEKETEKDKEKTESTNSLEKTKSSESVGSGDSEETDEQKRQRSESVSVIYVCFCNFFFFGLLSGDARFYRFVLFRFVSFRFVSAFLFS